jgi:hypothetical protein
MISARVTRYLTLILLWLSCTQLQAQVVVQKRVDSWNQEGYLMVMGTMILAFSLCLCFTYYENRRKKK